MKRRIQALASSSTGKAVKKRSWQEEGDDAEVKLGPGRLLLDKDSDEEGDADPPLPPPPPPNDHPASDEDAWNALEEAVGGTGLAERPPGGGPNPVVWMDISVAGKPRGRAFFELFRDVVPKTAENFRKLCIGVPEDPTNPDGRNIGYKGTELYKVLPGRLVEGGEFDRAADGKEFEDESFKLRHIKGGLLTMANDGPNTNTSRFQVILKPQPMLDGRQVVFGQVLTDSENNGSEHLHPLHWISAMATVSGTPIETIVIEDSGECDAAKAQQLRGTTFDGALETEEARYSRGGVHTGKLEDAISKETVVEMLELTETCLDSWEWQAKKAVQAADSKDRVRRASEVEAGLKALKSVLEEVEFKAGDVQGMDGKQGRKAKSQIFRVRDLEESLAKIY